MAQQLQVNTHGDEAHMFRHCPNTRQRLVYFVSVKGDPDRMYGSCFTFLGQFKFQQMFTEFNGNMKRLRVTF